MKSAAISFYTPPYCRFWYKFAELTSIWNAAIFENVLPRAGPHTRSLYNTKYRYGLLRTLAACLTWAQHRVIKFRNTVIPNAPIQYERASTRTFLGWESARYSANRVDIFTIIQIAEWEFASARGVGGLIFRIYIQLRYSRNHKTGAVPSLNCSLVNKIQISYFSYDRVEGLIVIHRLYIFFFYLVVVVFFFFFTAFRFPSSRRVHADLIRLRGQIKINTTDHYNRHRGAAGVFNFIYTLLYIDI